MVNIQTEVGGRGGWGGGKVGVVGGLWVVGLRRFERSISTSRLCGGRVNSH